MIHKFFVFFIIPSLIYQFVFIMMVFSVTAEIIIDNSFDKGQTIQPEENTYYIDSDFGYENGVNLFHSFQTFNIEKGMIASFSGPSGIQRIISRVTGGQSLINGTIMSEIPGADLFLINPNGIIFGASAQLKIDGSFYVSTADYLQMTESKRFNTGIPEKSGLTVSSPQNFGFLDPEIAPIIFQGSEPLSQETFIESSRKLFPIKSLLPQNEGFTVTGNNDICIIGGQISIENGFNFALKDNDNETNNHYSKGSIHLISIKSQADIYLDNMHDFSTETQFDNILIKDSVLNTGGQAVGGIYIVGEDIKFENSILYMDNYGEQNAKPINVIGNNISFIQKGKIFSNTFAKGNAANIHLNARSDIFLKEQFSSIYTYSGQNSTVKNMELGNTACISIAAQNFYVQNGARIAAQTYSAGVCSELSIKVSENIKLFNTNKLITPTSLFLTSLGKGKVGALTLEAKVVELADGAKLSVSTRFTGKGGSIIITADEVRLKGIRINDLSQPDQGSRIFVRSYGKIENSGDSGDLTINATNIILSDGAQIRAQTYGYGRGGNITLNASEKILLEGLDGRGFPAMINTSCDQSKFNAPTKGSGNVKLSAKMIELKNGAWISTHTDSGGDAGTIDITDFQQLKLSGECPSVEHIDKGKISSCIVSSAKFQSKGKGGKINICGNELILLNGAYIETGTESSHNAGEITIHANNITLMKLNSDNQSSMIASNTRYNQLDVRNNKTGDGGKITINAMNINLLNGAQISTSSIAKMKTSGKAGNIHINIGGTLRISGQSNHELESDRLSSGIYARSIQEKQAHAGEAGKIDIIANNLVMDNHGLISTNSNGLSKAGDIDIITRQSIFLNNSSIVSESNMPMTGEQHGGIAGSIRIHSGNDIQLFQSAHISTNAVSSGGGKIDIQNQNALTLIHSDITTNVRQGAAKGGDINIRSGLTVMDHSTISANAINGDGGAIYLYTRNLIQSPESRIEATSKRGNDGTVEIETPDVEKIHNFLNLSDTFLDNVKVVNTLCDLTNETDSIQLVVHAPEIPNLSATWYPMSSDTSLSLLSKDVTDQFDHISNDFLDEVLYQTE